MPYGLPVSGLTLAGPVVVTFGSFVLRLTSASALITKYLSVSIGLPAPMIGSQYPDAASVALYLPAACELLVKKCGSKIALSPAAFNVPYVSYPTRTFL